MKLTDIEDADRLATKESLANLRADVCAEARRPARGRLFLSALKGCLGAIVTGLVNE